MSVFPPILSYEQHFDQSSFVHERTRTRTRKRISVLCARDSVVEVWCCWTCHWGLGYSTAPYVQRQYYVDTVPASKVARANKILKDMQYVLLVRILFLYS